MKSVIIILLSFLMFACQKDNFKQYSKIEDFRILALIPSSPEVSPGATVTITPYVSDLTNSGPYSYQALACLDPGVSYGATPSCETSSTKVDLGSGTLSGLSAPLFTGAVTSFNVTIPNTILLPYSAVDQYNGVSYLVTYQVTNSSGIQLSSFHRVVVSSRATKNNHPVILDILGNGNSLGTVAAGSQVDLTISLQSGSLESYDFKSSDGSLSTATESGLITYFYMDGSAKYFRTSAASDVNTYTAPESYPSTRGSFIYVVVRDGRGGIAISSRQVN
jgi:hypothetical protein